MFELFDKDKNGTIEPKELCDVLSGLGRDLTQVELDALVTKMDKTGILSSPAICGSSGSVQQILNTVLLYSVSSKLTHPVQNLKKPYWDSGVILVYPTVIQRAVSTI